VAQTSPRLQNGPMMKTLFRLLLGSVIAVFLTECLYTEPVFKEGFSKIDPDLNAVWVNDPKSGDPRKMELAVCASLDDDRYLLHYPASDKDGIYYEARLLKVGSRSVLQLRELASLNEGLPAADAKRYTLLWIERDMKISSIRVRALDGEKLKDKGPLDVRKMLETSSTDWIGLFGDPMDFRRLNDQ